MSDPLFLQPTTSQDLYSWALGAAYRYYRLNDPSYALARDPSIDEKMDRDPKFAASSRYRRHLIAGRTWTVEPASDRDVDRRFAKVMTSLLKKCENLVEARFHLANAVVRGSAWGFMKGAIDNVSIDGEPDAAWWVIRRIQNVDRRRLHLRPEKGEDGTPERVRLVWWSWKRRQWELVDPSWFVCNVYDDTEANMGYGLGLRDALYFLMWFKEQLLADGLKAVKRWSRGIMKVGVDGLRASSKSNATRVREWERATAESRERDAIVFDKTDEFDLVFPTGEGAKLVLEFIRYADDGIEELMVGSHVATSSTEGGTYGLGKVHQQTTDILVTFDRLLLDSGAMTRDAIGALRRFNWWNLKRLGLERGEATFTTAEQNEADPSKAIDVVDKALKLKIPLRKKDVHEKIGFPQADDGEEVYEGAPDPEQPGGMGEDGVPSAPPENVLDKLFGHPTRAGAVPQEAKNGGAGPVNAPPPDAKGGGTAGYAAPFDESKHPRADDGQFAETAGEHHDHGGVEDRGGKADPEPPTARQRFAAHPAGTKVGGREKVKKPSGDYWKGEDGTLVTDEKWYEQHGRPASERPDPQIEKIEVGDIGVDPERFQFKHKATGEGGVTEQFRDVERFDPIKAGVVLVWRDEDGKPWIVDGHHRYELAKRTGHPRLNAFVLEHAHGISHVQARATAALRNIAAGHGDALDAAKAVRDMGWSVEDLRNEGISARSVLVRDAFGIAALEQSVFDRVVSEELPQAYAAEIGRRLEGKPAKQRQAAAAVADAGNQAEVESIVRQIATAPEVQETQETLFGAETETRSIFAERAKVEVALARRLKSDKALFSTLAKKAAKAESIEGTKINVEGSKSEAATADDLMLVLRTYGDHAGDVKDALDRAAREYVDGNRTGKALEGAVSRALDALKSVDWKTGVSAAPVGESPGDPSYGTGGFRFDEPPAVAAQARGYAGTWDESKHPRGQPENAGQFGPGGGGPKDAPARPAPSSETKGGDHETKAPARGAAAPDNGQAARDHETDAAITLAEKHEHSLDAYRDKATGQFTPERQAVHDRIVGGHFAGKVPVPKGQARTFYVLGGGSGAGKTSMVKSGAVRLGDVSTTVLIDPDAIKTQIPEFRPLKRAGSLVAGAFVHEESSHLAKRTTAEAFERGHNVVLDGTGDGSLDGLTKKLAAARKAGLRVVGEYATVSVDEAIRRSNERGKNNPDRGVVPEAAVRHTHASVSVVLPQAIGRGLFDEARVWDTEGVAPGQPPRMIAEYKDGKLTLHDEAAWNRFLLKGNEYRERPE